MKLLEKLRELRAQNTQEESSELSYLQSNHYDYANENNVDSFGVGATAMQDMIRDEILEVINLKNELSHY